MKPGKRLAIMLSSLLLGSAPQPGYSAPAAAGELPRATIGQTRQFDLTSSINGEAYRIQIFIPDRPPPPKGYAVLYLLDGNVLFGTYAGAARTRALAQEIEPAVVVGIASGDGSYAADRDLDFTMSDRTDRERAIVKEWDPDQKAGGAEAFFRTIQEEIRPRVSQIVAVDNARSALFGWSLGGLFVTHIMLAHPDAFASYIALSPSLWYNERAIFKEIPAFERRVSSEGLRPRFFLSVGALENRVAAFRKSSGATDDALAAENSYYRMIDNPKDLDRLLAPYFHKLGTQIDFHVFAGDTHNSVPWAAVNPILNFAFPLKSDNL